LEAKVAIRLLAWLQQPHLVVDMAATAHTPARAATVATVALAVALVSHMVAQQHLGLEPLGKAMLAALPLVGRLITTALVVAALAALEQELLVALV
jgi:hypothetical protein